jgi:membrane protease YdiL (CAAX protease family)
MDISHRRSSAPRLLATAMIWLAFSYAATVVVLLSTSWMALFAAFQAGMWHSPQPYMAISASPLVTDVAIFVGYGVMLIGAVRGARWARSPEQGFADRPIQLVGTVVLLVLLQVAWLVALAYLRWLVRHHLVTAPGVPPALTMPDIPLLALLKVIELALVAPVVEELFFRGWLWSALDRVWHAVPTAVVTGGLFLLIHAPSGVGRVIILLPLTILLSVARYRCDSVRASLALHMINNGLVLAEVWLAPLLLKG